MSLAAVMLET